MKMLISGLLGFLAFCGTAPEVDPNLEVKEQEQTMKSQKTQFGNIAYTESGKGPTIVLLHAAGHDHRDFAAIQGELTKSYRVIAIDWLGHGQSDKPKDLRNISAMLLADVLQDFVTELNIKDAVYVGNSVGAFAAAELAIHSPDRVKGLILVQSGGFVEQGFKVKAFCRFKGSEFWTSALWLRFPSSYLKIRNRYVNRILADVKVAKSEDNVAINAAIWRSFLSPEHDLRESAKKIVVPTLGVWGELDPVIPLIAGETMAKTIPNSKLIVMKTGHMPFAEDPEGFLKHVRPFLQETFQRNLTNLGNSENSENSGNLGGNHTEQQEAKRAK